MQNNREIHPPGFRHPDLEMPRIERDEADIAMLCELLENTWTNPFQDYSTELAHLSTGVIAPPEVSVD